MKTNQRLTQIKEKVNQLKAKNSNLENSDNEHQYNFNSTISEKVVDDFEKKHGISLPEEYRTFITTVADGGAGPCYGLYAFEQAVDLSRDAVALTWLPNDFTLTSKDIQNYLDHCKKCEDEGEGDLIRKMDMPDPTTGLLCVCDYGCNCYYTLIVTGEQAGTMWFMEGDQNTITPLFHNDGIQKTFSDWYEAWLDGELDLATDESKQEWNDQTKTISYDGWKLDAIPKEILVCKNLRRLILSRNELKKFPEEITVFKELRTLDLSMNPFKILSPAIGEFPKLKRLMINYTYITDLPAEIINLQNLNELSIFYSYKLKVLPIVINELPNLVQLKLSNGYELKEVTDIGNLTRLTVLDLRSCGKLKILHESLCKLKSLTRLYLGETALAKLPDDFNHLENLTDLDVSSDKLKLTHVVEKIKDLAHLEYLCISNQLAYPKSFASLTSVRHLKIKQNYTLWRKGEEKFPVASEITLIPNLRILEFDSNNDQATELPENIGTLSNLTELHLPRVTFFPESMKNMKQLKLIRGYKDDLSKREIDKLKTWLPECTVQIW